MTIRSRIRSATTSATRSGRTCPSASSLRSRTLHAVMVDAARTHSSHSTDQWRPCRCPHRPRPLIPPSCPTPPDPPRSPGAPATRVGCRAVSDDPVGSRFARQPPLHPCCPLTAASIARDPQPAAPGDARHSSVLRKPMNPTPPGDTLRSGSRYGAHVAFVDRMLHQLQPDAVIANEVGEDGGTTLGVWHCHLQLPADLLEVSYVAW